MRHGNGERYFDRHRSRWGVKPPSKNKIIEAIEKSLLDAGPEIKHILLASDCLAIAPLLAGHFGERLSVHFISKHVQDVGAGNSVVPPSYRFDVDMPHRGVDIIEDDVASFSEILTLAKCRFLCGGSSYFFESIIGFSSCASVNINSIDNIDRYIDIPSSSLPLAEAENKELAASIVAILKASFILTDGIFLKVTLKPSLQSKLESGRTGTLVQSSGFIGEKIMDYALNAYEFELCYFDTPLYEGGLMKLKKNKVLDVIRSALLDCRMY